jgi:hypothetical protein
VTHGVSPVLEVHGTLASEAIERAVGGMRQRPMSSMGAVLT